ncbi:ssl1498 family light-harvesting-like protein [Cyanobacteria bacterium FACHB-63]|nr:ssl1498 family light-harvesting-like protein [Cyanobacteria bacterium FACHB-63]
MRYVKEEGGLLNNFAIEPKMYEAEPPTQNQKRNYILLAVGGAILIGGLMAVAIAVS